MGDPEVVPLKIGLQEAPFRAIVLLYTLKTESSGGEHAPLRKRVMPIRSLGWLGISACARKLVEAHRQYLSDVAIDQLEQLVLDLLPLEQLEALVLECENERREADAEESDESDDEGDESEEEEEEDDDDDEAVGVCTSPNVASVQSCLDRAISRAWCHDDEESDISPPCSSPDSVMAPMPAMGRCSLARRRGLPGSERCCATSPATAYAQPPVRAAVGVN